MSEIWYMYEKQNNKASSAWYLLVDYNLWFSKLQCQLVTPA